MATLAPFQTSFESTETGQTVIVVNSSVKILDTTDNPTSNVIQVTNLGVTTAWFRMTNETAAQATAAITQNDTPIPINTVRLYSNPNPGGQTACAVIVASITTSVLQIFFTPGIGGLT